MKKTREQKPRKTSNPAPEIESCTVTTHTEWCIITAELERADAIYLAEIKMSQERAGEDCHLSLIYGVCVPPKSKISDHATPRDPVLTALRMKKIHWQEIVEECNRNGDDLASAIRWAIAERCKQIKKNRNRIKAA